MRLSELTKEIFKEKFPPEKVVFRVDAGRIRGLSFGHLSRCLVLAKGVRKAADSEVLFLMRNYNEGMAYAETSGYDVRAINSSLSSGDYYNLMAEILSDVKPDYLVVDLPEEDPSPYLEHARKKGILTVCLDDTANRTYQANVILNSSILADRDKYGQCLPGTRFLLGAKYFIMDNFPGKNNLKSDNKGLSVIITFGGSDPLNLTEKVVAALQEAYWDNVSFKIILGPGFDRESPLKNPTASLPDFMQIIDYPKDLLSCFVNSDIAICSGGRTLYELQALGIPTLAVATNENEANVIERFKKKNLILSGLSAWNKDLFLGQLRTSLRRFFERNPRI